MTIQLFVKSGRSKINDWHLIIQACLVASLSFLGRRAERKMNMDCMIVCSCSS